MTKTINITRVFEAPVELVWQMWSDEEKVKLWWGPEYFTCPFAKIDFRVGGTYLFSMEAPGGAQYWSTGTYTEIIKHLKIVASDHFADAQGNIVPASYYKMPGEWPDEMIVTVTFEENDGKTTMTLVHEGHPIEMASDATKGWNGSLDKFAAALLASS